MILLNKNKISRVLYNKNQVGKILYNKYSLYSKSLKKDDYNGYLNFELPQISGISDYFIFILFSHFPIVKTSKKARFKEVILSLTEGVIQYNGNSLNQNYVEFSNLKINEGDPTAIFGANEENFVNGSNILSFNYGFDRVETSRFEKGIVSFLGGSTTHFFPNEVITGSFNINANMDGQLVSAILIGQENVDNAQIQEPIKLVEADIKVKIDNNALGTSAYDLYGYCIFSDGEYYLTSIGGTYKAQTNELVYSDRVVLFNNVWFDALPST